MTKFQISSGAFCDKLDYIAEIVTWRRREETRKVVRVLLTVAMLTLIFPLPPSWLVAFMAGIAGFVVFPLKTYFPALFQTSNIRGTMQIAWHGLTTATRTRVLPITRRKTSSMSKLKPKPDKPKPDKPKAVTKQPQVWYTCSIFLELAKSDDTEPDALEAALQALSHAPQAIDVSKILDLMLLLICRLKSSRRMFLVPPHLEMEGECSENFSTLNLSDRMPLRECGLVGRENHALLDSCEDMVGSQQSECPSLKVGFLINAAFQDTPPLYCYSGSKVALFFRVYGTVRLHVEQFQPAMCSNQAPAAVRELVISCCRESQSRPTVRQCASVLAQCNRVYNRGAPESQPSTSFSLLSLPSVLPPPPVPPVVQFQNLSNATSPASTESPDPLGWIPSVPSPVLEEWPPPELPSTKKKKKRLFG
eukprot:NODE_644_length_1544_cov_70.051505_g531_i0.p1 GENE.NODE_644_length_1544_cov_70.051505_g531_i0~~NODE_644_length_1544_cov_70.051505_g531_i0.p1  ORF type:complete len:484 (+),score=127.43 NODE_644_length_1544_cov_70.051505_g531_i0:195-1454(+)